MTRTINSSHEFNPFTHVLAADERLRLVDDKLTVEKSAERSKASGWNQFWTRNQYSQTKILKKMSNLYKDTKKQQNENKDSHINKTFLENYTNLVGRAKSQNEKCSKLNFIYRFFSAKSAINLDNDYEKIASINKDLEKSKENEKLDESDIKLLTNYKSKKEDEKLDENDIKLLINYKSKKEELSEARITEITKLYEEESTPWWDDQGLDGTDNIFAGFGYPISTIETILDPLGKKAKNGNTSTQLTSTLQAIGLLHVQGHIDHKINGPLHLERYLLKNKDYLAERLQTLDFIE